MKRGKINYFGWLGHDNLGDEALYLVTQKVFSEYDFVPSCYERQCSRVTFFGGGTFFPIWPLTILPNKYNYAFGVGVEDPTFGGKDFDPIVVDYLKRFNFRLLGVRGNMSKKLLRGLGIASEVVGDPCLLLEPESYKKKEKGLVAVNVGTSYSRIWGGDEGRVLRETVNLLKLIQKDGYHPTLIPFWKQDIPYIERISRETNVDIFENWMDISQVLDFIASCHLLIGEKLHSAVFSASTYTPFISIEYRPKCLEFAKSVGFEKYNVRTDQMTTERIMALFHDLSDGWGEMRNQLIRKVGMYRKRLREFAARIIEDIESLPNDKWSTPSPLKNLKSKVLYKTDLHLYYTMPRIWRIWRQSPIRNWMEHIPY